MNKVWMAIATVVGLLLFAGGAVWAQGSGYMTGTMMGPVYDESAAAPAGAAIDCPFAEGAQRGSGMMGGQYGGMMGGQYGGMMGDFGVPAGGEPLSIEQVRAAVVNYLSTLDDSNLALGEIMIFENHAYAQVLDATTGDGAFELLVDPVSGNVYPEPGPNMMWNTEYGMMSGQHGGMMGGQHGSMMNGAIGGRHGGMMNGGYGHMVGGMNVPTSGGDLLSLDEVVASAQAYLDANMPGAIADDHATAFPGYWTLHIEQDGLIVGMLSVHATGGQVFPHHWHGAFVESSEGMS